MSLCHQVFSSQLPWWFFFSQQASLEKRCNVVHFLGTTSIDERNGMNVLGAYVYESYGQPYLGQTLNTITVRFLERIVLQNELQAFFRYVNYSITPAQALSIEYSQYIENYSSPDQERNQIDQIIFTTYLTQAQIEAIILI